MTGLLTLPFLFQGLAIAFDEFIFHRARGLPRWERIGHPLDTLTVVMCFLYAITVPYSFSTALIFLALSIFSCIFITKDEWVHKDACLAKEMWLHSILFILHPIVLASIGLIWITLARSDIANKLGLSFHDLQFLAIFLKVQTCLVGVFFFYQLIYWNILWKPKRP